MPGKTRYNAPPVSYPAGRCVLDGWVLLCLCLLLLGTLAAAAAQGADPREHASAARFLALGLGGWAVLATWAGWHWQRSAAGQLLWREGQWQWCPEGRSQVLPVAAVRLALDGQGVLLLRLEGERSLPRWLWLERRRDAARWDDLRRAVWATQRTPITSA